MRQVGRCIRERARGPGDFPPARPRITESDPADARGSHFPPRIRGKEASAERSSSILRRRPPRARHEFHTRHVSRPLRSGSASATLPAPAIAHCSVHRTRRIAAHSPRLTFSTRSLAASASASRTPNERRRALTQAAISPGGAVLDGPGREAAGAAATVAEDMRTGARELSESADPLSN